MSLFKSDHSTLKITLTIITLTMILSLGYFHEQLSDRWQFFIVIFLSGLVCILLVCLAKKNSSTIKVKSIEESEPTTMQKILVVDDNPANRRFISEILKPLSISITEASSGREAIVKYQQTTFSLIFMDIEMDDVDGIEATRQIRQISPKDKRIPIIATSAHNTKEKKILALTSGFDDYLIKPIDEEQIKSTINRWIGKEPFLEKVLGQDVGLASAASNANRAESVAIEDSPRRKIVDIQQSLTYSRQNAELAKDMLLMLIELVQTEKGNILTLFKDEKWQELGHLVHKISGGSCYCGVPDLQKQAALIDRLIDEDNIDLVKENFIHLEQAINDLLDWNEEHDISVIFES